MIVYSGFDADPKGRAIPALCAAYPTLSWTGAYDADSTGRTPLTILGGPAPDLAALAADWRFPAAPDATDPADAGAYRGAVLGALARWRDLWTQTVEYGGTSYTLRANPDAQANFTRYVVALSQQLSAGVTLPADVLPLQDAAGGLHPLAVSDLLALLAVYSRAVMIRELQWNARIGMAEAATTGEELDAITWG